MTITILMVGFLCVNGLGMLYVQAMYTPPNMTRQQFEAAARFGAWELGPDGPVRSFVLQTPKATITGWDYASRATDIGAPFGEVHLKAHSFARPLAFAILLPVILVWIIPWLIGWALAQLRHEKQTAT